MLYRDHEDTSEDLTFVEVLTQMRGILQDKKYTQIPQFTASKPIDVNAKFDLVPDNCTGTRRALLIGINYVGHSPGQLSGCHNDVGNMVDYIKNVHGFQDDNIVLLLDKDGETQPTKANILAAYKTLVDQCESGDCVFLHYSGHGSKQKDDDGDEEDGFDEVLVPLDFKTSGMIRDDDLFDLIIKPMPDGVHLVCLMDCCHSGSILDLPYSFKADGTQTEIQENEKFDKDKWFLKMGGEYGGKLGASLGKKFFGAKGAELGEKFGSQFGSAIGNKLFGGK